jgi:hypothetical protein
MITPNINQRVKERLEATYHAGASGEVTDGTVLAGQLELMALIREEAINLADKIIGKDRVVHSRTDLEQGVDTINREDKAVFDLQVQQRIALAKYQNPQNGPTGPEDIINADLSENES